MAPPGPLRQRPWTRNSFCLGELELRQKILPQHVLTNAKLFIVFTKLVAVYPMIYTERNEFFWSQSK